MMIITQYIDLSVSETFIRFSFVFNKYLMFGILSEIY